MGHRPKHNQITDEEIEFLKEIINARNFDLAISTTTSLLKIYPKESKLLNILGNAFFLSEDINSAIDTFEYILAYEPSNVEAINSLAVIYYEEDRYEDAITKFVAALHLDPKNDLVYRNFVSTLKSTDTCVIQSSD